MSRTSWIEAFRGLGDAILDLVRAEVQVLFAEWKRAAFELAKILGIAFGVLLIFVYLPFLVLFAAVDGFARWFDWPLWGSALFVLGLAALLIAALGGIAAWIWSRRLVGPTTSIQRRLDDHGQWWQRRVYFEEPHLAGGRGPSLGTDSGDDSGDDDVA